MARKGSLAYQKVKMGKVIPNIHYLNEELMAKKGSLAYQNVKMRKVIHSCAHTPTER